MSQPHDDRLLGELTALADGTLTGSRRAELEAAVAADPELAAALAEQRRAVTLIRAASAEVRAPLALRERVEAQSRRHVGPPPRRRRVLSIVLAGAAAAALALAVVFTAPGAPTVDDAVAFQAAAPTGAGPRPDGPALLALDHAGVAFPNWASSFGWAASGTRTGEIEGRAATTVYYEKDGRTLAYTIVSGDPLDPPEAGRTVDVDGTPVTIFSVDGKHAVTWLRGGHSCVMSGAGVPEAKLAELAGWRAKGAVEF